MNQPLIEYRYWASLIDCERPAGVDCSKIDDGGEEKCFPCMAREDISDDLKKTRMVINGG